MSRGLIVLFMLLWPLGLWAGTTERPGAVTPAVEVVCLRDVQGVVSGVTAETAFPGSGCTIPGNLLTVNRALRVTAYFDAVTNTAGGNNWSVRLGGTSVFSHTGITNADDKKLDLTIFGRSLTSQVTGGSLGNINSGGSGGTAPGLTETTVDMSGDVVLDITVTPGNVGNTATLGPLLVEVIQQ